MAEIQGVNHLALNVTDVQASASWYERVFGVQRAYENKDDTFEIVLVVIGSAAVGLMRKSPDAADSFSEFRTGLDHLAFGVATKEDVQTWKDRLDSLGVANSGVIDDPFGRHLNFRDPDNIALEVFANAS